MSNIMYHYRNLTALVVAITVGLFSLAAMPAASSGLARTVAAAAMPHCVESQNPFLGAPS